MTTQTEGNAVVYCQGAFNTTNGKTAHGLVRRTRRYRVLAVVDSRLAGKDAGQELDGKSNGVPIQNDVLRAFKACQETGTPATHLVIGLAPDGGRLPPQARRDVVTAIQLGLHVDSGLHDFLSEDEEIAQLAASKRCGSATFAGLRRGPTCTSSAGRSSRWTV